MTAWPIVRLGEVADLNPRLTSRPTDETMVSFLAMADVEVDGTTTSGVDRPFHEVARGYTQFRNGDVLVAKITPCFENGKIAQANTRHAQAAGSTEFHVVRPRSEILDGRYLHHFLRQPLIRIAGERKMTGSGGQRRVPEHYLSRLEIPLPSPSEQRRIAKMLDQADELPVKRRQAIALLDDLAQSVFFEMFGDPGARSSRWPITTVANVAEQVTDGEHLTPIRESTGIKLLSARNIQDGYLDLQKVDHIGPAEYQRISRRCKPELGDILISCSGTIGRVALVDTKEPLSLVRSVALIKPDRSQVTSNYMLNLLRTPALRTRMLRAANASSQANLFQGPIKKLPIPLPPMSLQCELDERSARITKHKASNQDNLALLDELFGSLRQRAFRGEL